MKDKNKEELDMQVFRDVLDKLIKDNKITFSFSNNNLLELEPLQMCYNKSNKTLELEFRDAMPDYVKELKRLFGIKKLT